MLCGDFLFLSSLERFHAVQLFRILCLLQLSGSNAVLQAEVVGVGILRHEYMS